MIESEEKESIPTTPSPTFSDKWGTPLLGQEGRGNPSPDENRGLPLGKGELPNFNAWQLAWELGYTIAIPIVIFALVGRWADKQFDSSPWLLLVGILLSIFISSTLVYRKVSRILK